MCECNGGCPMKTQNSGYPGILGRALTRYEWLAQQNAAWLLPFLALHILKALI